MNEYVTPAPSGASTPHADQLQHAPVPDARRDELPCESYLPGHHMHPVQWARATHAPRRLVRRLRVDGFRVAVVLDDGAELAWRHHDPVRLRRVLEEVPGTVAVCPEQHVLVVGGHWFSCATDASWQPCSRR